MALITIPDKNTGDTLSSAEFNQLLDALKEGTRSIKTDISSATVAALDQIVASVDAVSVFRYDTSKDSDGGGWTKRYNNNCPALAAFIATSTGVKCYDLTDPDTPEVTALAVTLAGISSVKAENGLLVVGGTFGVKTYRLDLGDIELKDEYTTTSTPAIVNDTVNHIATTVLDTAPIDQNTWLPKQTKLALTAGGSSWITDNDGIYDGTGGIVTVAGDINSDGLSVIASATKLYIFNTVPTADIAMTSADYTFDTAGTSGPHISGTIANVKLTGNEIIVGTDEGLWRIIYNQSTPAESVVTQITSDFNTSGQHGDIKFCTLADTIAEVVSGTDLVTNGTFDTDTTGWSSLHSATLTIDTARLNVTNTIASFGGAEQVINLPAGTYVVTVDYDNNGSNTRNWLEVGSTTNDSDLLQIATDVEANTATGTISGFFTVHSTMNVYVQAQILNVFPNNGLFDNFSVKRAIPDRSVNADHFALTGTCTKTAVATNAELVWHNFSVDQSVTLSADISATGMVMWWEDVAGVPHLYCNDLSGGTDYDNGVSGTTSTNVTITGTTMTIKGSADLALVRPSATISSAEYIAHIYETERKMFEEDAKVTLSGSSDSVPALDYDNDIELLTVLTDVQDQFHGLVNVNQDTISGTAQSVSTGDGAVLIGTSTQAAYYQPAKNLREELVRLDDQEQAFDIIPKQFWFENLVVNGKFISDVAHWVNYDVARGTATWVSGRIRLTNDAVGSGYTFVYQEVQTIIGTTYNVVVDAYNVDTVSKRLSVGKTEATSDYGYALTSLDEELSLTFTATTSSVFVQLLTDSPTNNLACEFDNVLMRPCDADGNIVYQLPNGWKETAVYHNRSLFREGVNEDYVIVDDNFTRTVKPNVAPGIDDDTCIMAMILKKSTL